MTLEKMVNLVDLVNLVIVVNFVFVVNLVNLITFGKPHYKEPPLFGHSSKPLGSNPQGKLLHTRTMPKYTRCFSKADFPDLWFGPEFALENCHLPNNLKIYFKPDVFLLFT